MTEDDNPELNEVTENTEKRWTYLGSVITAIALIGFMLIVGLGAAGYLTLGAISGGWFYLFSTVVLMAAVWLWGEDTLNAVRKAREDE